MTTGRESWRHQLFLVRRAARASLHLRRVPGAQLQAVFPGIELIDVTLRHNARPRGLPHGDAYVLALITAYLRPKRILEIGTGTGEGTLILASNAAEEVRIDTLDLGAAKSSLGEQSGDQPLAADAVGEAFAGSPVAGRIEQHLGAARRSTSAPTAARWTSCSSTARTPSSTCAAIRARPCRCSRRGGTIRLGRLPSLPPRGQPGPGVAARRRARRAPLETTRFAALRTPGARR